MGDIQTQLPIRITDGTNTVTITGASALKVDNSGITQPVSGTVTAVPSGTTTVAGTVTNVPSGTQSVAGTVTNVPSGTQSVAYGSGTFPVSGTVTNVPSGTQPVSGTVTNVPSGTQSVAYGSGTFPVSGTVTAVPTGTTTVTGTVTNVPSGTQTVAGTVTNVPSGTQTITGTVTTNADADVAPGTAPSKVLIGGMVYNTAAPAPTNGQALAFQSDSAGNLKVAGTLTTTPSGTQTVEGTVTAVQSGTYTVVQASGSTVTAVPSGTFTTAPTGTQSVAYGSGTFPVSGTVTAVPSGTQTVTGTVTAIPETSDVVAFQATVATVAAASTGTISYTVTAAKTLYFRGVMASSSGGPCKVVVDYGAGPTVVCTAFYSTTSPFLEITFPQPLMIPAETVVNVKIQNNAGSAQDVYATIFGAEH